MMLFIVTFSSYTAAYSFCNLQNEKGYKFIQLMLSQVVCHLCYSPYFSTLFSAAMSPYIPSVCAPDDTANFEDFEGQRDCGDDHLVTPQSQRGQRGFSGKSLPFIGFTFTRMDSVNLDLNLSASAEKCVDYCVRELINDGLFSYRKGPVFFPFFSLCQ